MEFKIVFFLSPYLKISWKDTVRPTEKRKRGQSRKLEHLEVCFLFNG